MDSSDTRHYDPLLLPTAWYVALLALRWVAFLVITSILVGLPVLVVAIAFDFPSWFTSAFFSTLNGTLPTTVIPMVSLLLAVVFVVWTIWRDKIAHARSVAERNQGHLDLSGYRSFVIVVSDDMLKVRFWHRRRFTYSQMYRFIRYGNAPWRHKIIQLAPGIIFIDIPVIGFFTWIAVSIFIDYSSSLVPNIILSTFFLLFLLPDVVRLVSSMLKIRRISALAEA